MEPPERLVHVLLRIAIGSLLITCVTALSDAPPTKSFLRRAGGTAAVIGDFLYLDGGDISQRLPNGTITEIPRRANAVNSTLSIGLSESWASSDVDIRKISRDFPSRARGGLWKDDVGDSFYVFFGQDPYGHGVDDPSLWRFDADGKGGGKWSEQKASNPGDFRDMVQSRNGAYTQARGVGFWAGGEGNGWTRPYDVLQPVPGMLSYNMSTKTWTNHTKTEYSPYGTLGGGNLEYVPTFGPNGVILVLGGGYDSTLGNPQGGPEGRLDLGNITFFDPITMEWFHQETTGVPPTRRWDFCTVGVKSMNGTYEIFLFGGTNGKRFYGDVYVLSLPLFHWDQIGSETEEIARADHVCVVVGGRQMLSVGGDALEPWLTPDVFPQGLGVFDMVEWVWSDEYDAGAGDYDSRDDIKEWYKDGAMDKMNWSSPEIEALFTGRSDDDKEKPNIGAIVGGAIGGFVALSGLALGAFCFLRRRKRRKIAELDAAQRRSSPDSAAKSTVQSPHFSEMATTYQAAELPAQDDRQDDSWPRQHEVPGETRSRDD